MKIRVVYKDYGHQPYEFTGVAYQISEEGEVDIYKNETEVCATVKADEWLSVEKIYEDGDEEPDVVIPLPKDAEELADYISEPSPTIRLDEGPLKWVNKEL